MQEIYTIGFTKKSAEIFFGLLIRNSIDIVLDVRLNNTSQLSGFSKYPDIKYFLNSIAGIQYLSDIKFSPSEEILKNYKANKIKWNEYVLCFNNLMKERDIEKYIYSNYKIVCDKKVCLLCSEEKPDNCHRSLVANEFNTVFGNTIIHL
jgi:uncharacterized protein (DUF488 family)